jgi:transcriptional regulator with XRE-family HTH domain
MSEILSLGEWVRRRRKALDLTQDELAVAVGCSKELIAKIEQDARRPSKQVAELLAQALCLAPEEVGLFVRAARAELAADQLVDPLASLPRPTLVAGIPTPVGTTVPSPSAADGLPSGTVTFLFTDIEGSTRLHRSSRTCRATWIELYPFYSDQQNY